MMAEMRHIQFECVEFRPSESNAGQVRPVLPEFVQFQPRASSSGRDGVQLCLKASSSSHDAHHIDSDLVLDLVLAWV